MRAAAGEVASAMAAPPRIVLVRHGRSAYVHRGWIDGDGVRRWLAAYDAAGIGDDDVPPPPLRALAARAVVVASDLPRARASAERLLGPGAPVELTPLLRETPPPTPPLPAVRLPLAAWGLGVALYALYRALRARPVPEATRAQADAAARWLAGLAAERGVVLAVTHAAFRGHLARALAADGWRGPRWRGYGTWSAWELTRPTPPAVR